VIGDGGAAKAEFERHAAERAEAARRAQADELAERVKACAAPLHCLDGWRLPDACVLAMRRTKPRRVKSI
jgi:hypothetical protein